LRADSAYVVAGDTRDRERPSRRSSPKGQLKCSPTGSRVGVTNRGDTYELDPNSFQPLTTDQRGFVRTKDGNGDGSKVVDIGAFGQ
jgi:hypothetical protein